MLGGECSPVDGTEGRSSPTKGSASLKPGQEVLAARDPESRGNNIPADLISSQPLPASAPPAERKNPPPDLHEKPICLRCGLTVPDHRAPPVSPALSRLQDSKLSVNSGGSSNGRRSRRSRSRSRSSVAGSQQHTTTPADSCLRLLLACLSCQCSVLLLGLLDSCSSCLDSLCSSCCHACTRCCSAIQEVQVEEFNCNAHCHSVLFDSCCEPTECLEFCLDCCDIVHRS